MREQNNMSQRKEQNKTLQGQLSEVEIGNLLEKEFGVMIVKMMPRSWKQNGDMSQEKTRNASQGTRRTKGQTVMNNIIIEIK